MRGAGHFAKGGFAFRLSGFNVSSAARFMFQHIVHIYFGLWTMKRETHPVRPHRGERRRMSAAPMPSTPQSDHMAAGAIS